LVIDNDAGVAIQFILADSDDPFAAEQSIGNGDLAIECLASFHDAWMHGGFAFALK